MAAYGKKAQAKVKKVMDEKKAGVCETPVPNSHRDRSESGEKIADRIGVRDEADIEFFIHNFLIGGSPLLFRLSHPVNRPNFVHLASGLDQLGSRGIGPCEKNHAAPWKMRFERRQSGEKKNHVAQAAIAHHQDLSRRVNFYGAGSTEKKWSGV